MAKKSLVFAIAFAASLSIAGVASAQESAFEGFYAGGQVGYSNINADVTITGVGSRDDNGDGFGGGGFVGFGGTNGKLYGAVEAEIGYDGADWNGTVLGTPADVEARLTYGAGFRIGGVIDDTFLIYGRLGWIRTNAEASHIAIGTDDEDFDGFRFGGGVEAMLADNIGVRGEYTYTM